MHESGSDAILSATDLSNFLACRHLTALDLSVALGKLRRPFNDDPLLELLWQRGLEHERAYVESLRATHGSITDLTDQPNSPTRAIATLEAMRRGDAAIVQGALQHGRWFGKPDLLIRVDRPSALGQWSYEISDTKLARDTKAGTILQLSLYSGMLTIAQGAAPDQFHVVTPDPGAGPPRVESYRVDDYGAYFRRVRDRMIAAVAQGDEALAEENYPDPVDHCQICHWSPTCRAKRRADDHLSLVANITREQRRELESRAVRTLTDLATLPIPLAFKPKRGSVASYVRSREQARLQHESRDIDPPRHERLDVEADKGLCRLPEPTDGDLFLDLEGDPFAGENGGGREYLFGLASADGTYRAKWAFNDRDERQAFEWVMDTIVDAVRAHPGMHAFHYAPYEPSAFKRLMGRYVTRERELDAMLRAGRFVDLYAVVRQGLRAGIERYSIKSLEALYGYTRDVALPDANRGLRAMELALGTGRTSELPESVRAIVEGYNRDDCVSTLRLRDWLESDALDTVIASGNRKCRARSSRLDEPPPKVDDRARRVEALRALLLEGIPDERADRTPDQQGRWLLAYLLDFHRREDKSTWSE